MTTKVLKLMFFAAVAALLAADAIGGTIAGNIVAPLLNSKAIDISSGTDDWIYFGRDTVKKAGVESSFSDPVCVKKHVAIDSHLVLGYSSGAIAGKSDDVAKFVDCDFVSASSVHRDGISFTHKLLAPSEKLSVYVVSFHAKASITATLGEGGEPGATFSVSDVVFPATNGDGEGRKHCFGILNLTVSGKVGETLTVRIVGNKAKGAKWGCAGLQAASVAADVPQSAAEENARNTKQ